MSRMKKKKLKVKKAKHQTENLGLRTGFLQFGEEQLRITALSHKREKEINDEFAIADWQNAKEHYIERLADKKVPMDMRIIMENKLTDASLTLFTCADMAGDKKLREMIDKPEEWFETLSSSEIYSLKMKAMAWLMYVDINELYLELFNEAVFHFFNTKGKSNMTGEDVGEYLKDLELQYISLKKNPKCLGSALQDAQAKRVTAAYNKLQGGVEESSE